MKTPASSQIKIAFTGTNCSGKTTAALDTTVRLKMAGKLAEVVSSQDRKISWKDDHFPVDYRAHYGMMTNLIHAEVQAELKGDAEIVVTDRSILDLYAIATYDHPNDIRIAAMEDMVKAWVSSYTRIFYLEPLPYQADNKRPNDEFRMATHGQLVKLMDKYKFPNLVRIKRQDVWAQIRQITNVPAHPVFEQDAKWQEIAQRCSFQLLVRLPVQPNPNDVDAWLVQNGAPLGDAQEAMNKVRELYLTYFGSDLPLHLMLVPQLSTTYENHRLYSPEISC